MPTVTIQERTFHFSISVLRYLRRIPRTIETNVLRKQLFRSATSIGANIVEAQQSATKKEFLQYNSIALRSARETEYWLKICQTAHDTQEIRGEEEKLLQECNEIAKILAAILLKGRGLR